MSKKCKKRTIYSVLANYYTLSVFVSYIKSPNIENTHITIFPSK